MVPTIRSLDILEFLVISPFVTLDTYLVGKLMVLGGIYKTTSLFLFKITQILEKTILEKSLVKSMY